MISSKKAQLTLFVILGIILVAAIVFFFTLSNNELNPFRQKTSSPAEYLSTCIEEAIADSEGEFFESFSSLGGSSLLYKYNLQSMPFLCYSTEFYSPCIPQNPLLIESVRKNMENYVSRELSRCILTLKEDYENKGYSFEYSSFTLSLTFNELDISYDAKTSIRIDRGDESILISTRYGNSPSSLPKLLRTAETIVNYESVFCEFNYMTWQAINRDLIIKRFRAGDQTKVYSVGLRGFDNEIKFAIRTCVLPAGV
jgi:hypothetical protein